MKSWGWSVAVSQALKTEGRQGLPAQFCWTVNVTFTKRLYLKRKKVRRRGTQEGHLRTIRWSPASMCSCTGKHMLTLTCTHMHTWREWNVSKLDLGKIKWLGEILLLYHFNCLVILWFNYSFQCSRNNMCSCVDRVSLQSPGFPETPHVDQPGYEFSTSWVLGLKAHASTPSLTDR